MKAHKLLMKARPAASVICPGCERRCVMPIQVPPMQGTTARAFVVCDKRSDINRVDVPIEHLEQWQVSGHSVADLMADLMGLCRPLENDADIARWELGVFRGAKHSSHLLLLADGKLTLTLAGHATDVADVLTLEDGAFAIEKRTLNRQVDTPVAGGGYIESALQRRARVKKRVEALKATGTRNFLKVAAAEENISVPRLKQLLKKARADEEQGQFITSSSRRAR